MQNGDRNDGRNCLDTLARNDGRGHLEAQTRNDGGRIRLDAALAHVAPAPSDEPPWGR